MVNKSFPLVKRTYKHVGEVISTDLALGLPLSLRKNVCLAVFVDSYSKFVWVKPLISKSEAQNYIPKLVALIKCQTERTVKTIRSDNGGEFMSTALKKYLDYSGIIHDTTVPYVHQQNGRSEVHNRILFNYIRALLLECGLPMPFWDDAVRYAAHAMNTTFIRHTPFTGEKLTAYEHLYGHLPDRKHWFIFGSDATIFIPIEARGNQQKLQPRTCEGVYVGLAPFQSGALFYVPEKGEYVSAV